jgi:hypothetical protein
MSEKLHKFDRQEGAREAISPAEVKAFYHAGDWEDRYLKLVEESAHVSEQEIRAWKSQAHMTREAIIVTEQVGKLQRGQRMLAAEFARAFTKQYPNALVEASLVGGSDFHESQNAGRGAVATPEEIKAYYEEHGGDYEQAMKDAEKDGKVFLIGFVVKRTASAQTERTEQLEMTLEPKAKLYPKWVADMFFDLMGSSQKKKAA